MAIIRNRYIDLHYLVRERNARTQLTEACICHCSIKVFPSYKTTGRLRIFHLYGSRSYKSQLIYGATNCITKLITQT